MLPSTINIFEKAARKAGRVMSRDFGEIENLQIQSKSLGDFVTNSDLKVEEILLDTLKYYYPDASFITEESGTIKGGDEVIVIDPIDGTTNFMHSIPHFAISLALKSKDEIIAGVIYDPIKDEIFYGEKNSGAYLNNQRIRVSKRKNINQSLFASGDKNLDQYNNINIRKSGSAALDLAYVACGRYEGYFQKNLSIWDIAAGLIILKEAGGITSELNINNHTNLKIIASNPYINENLLNILSKF